MARLTLQQPECFRAIARTGNISAAVQKMVSRSAMASALGDLEKALDAELVIGRKAQGIVVTGPGQQRVGRRPERLADEVHQRDVEAARGPCDRAKRDRRR